MNKRYRFLQSLRKYYEAEMEKWNAEIETVLGHGVGVGDHPHVEDMKSYLEEYDHAKSCLESLKDFEDDE